MFGEATKFSQYLLDADTRYTSTFTFGVATSTADKEGDVLCEVDASALTRESIESQVNHYLGDILQIPPMVSALKHNGQPLYKLARQGIEIEREARSVTLFHYQILAFRPGPRAQIDVDVHCSKGTYIRSLADDLGKALGVGAHVSALHRSWAGGFSDKEALSIEALTNARGEGAPEVLDKYLKPVDILLGDMPQITIDKSSAHYFCQGQSVMDVGVYRLGAQGDKVRVCRQDGQFLGVADITDDGRIAPRRLVVFGQ